MTVTDEYKNKIDEIYGENSKASETVLKVIDIWDDAIKNYVMPRHNYKPGEDFFLKKGTFLHGTYMNCEGFEYIIEKNGFVCSNFVGGRGGKYPGCIGVWNLKEDILLRDYINYYSGGTVRYNILGDTKEITEVISYDKMLNIVEIIKEKKLQRWDMELTKETRFIPSLIQDSVQLAFIINTDNKYMKEF